MPPGSTNDIDPPGCEYLVDKTPQKPPHPPADAATRHQKRPSPDDSIFGQYFNPLLCNVLQIFNAI
jgi:hypothetical protein